MRLFVGRCNHCQERIYLPIAAPSRDQLAHQIGDYSFKIECPRCHNHSSYEVKEVSADPSPSSTPAGAILGGLVGLIGGPAGMLVGASLGTLWGAGEDEEEKKKVIRFNRS
jgi:hypothetical protein